MHLFLVMSRTSWKQEEIIGPIHFLVSPELCGWVYGTPLTRYNFAHTGVYYCVCVQTCMCVHVCVYVFWWACMIPYYGWIGAWL